MILNGIVRACVWIGIDVMEDWKKVKAQRVEFSSPGAEGVD